MRAGLSRSYIYSSDQLADQVVTGQKIADQAVNTPQLADGAVSISKLSIYITDSRAKAYLSTAQSYSATTDTKVQFDTKVFDPLNHYDNTTNYRYTVTTGYEGQYVVHAHVTISAAASNTQPLLKIFLNGGMVHTSFLHEVGGVGIFTGEIMGVLNLIAGDYVEIYVYSPLAGTIQLGSDRTYFEVFRLP